MHPRPSCTHDLICIKCFPPSPPPCLDPQSVGDLFSWGQNQTGLLANTVAMGTVSSNHVVADQLFWSIPTLPHLHVYYALQYILMQFDAALRLARGFCKSVCGQAVPCLVCNVSLPLCHFCWLLGAAQGRGIFRGERRVQELPVFPAHGLHRRGESPLAQRSGPLTGHRARRGGSQMFNSSSCDRHFICRFSDTFSFILRSCPRKKKCWSGRGSMRTVGRR